MFGTKQKVVPSATDPEVDQFVVRTVNSDDRSVATLLNEHHEAGWTVAAVNAVAVGSLGGIMSSIQVVFSK